MLNFILFNFRSFSFFGYVQEVKDFLLNLIIGYLPKIQSRLIFSMLFGTEENLTFDLYHSLKISGMLHVISVSGYNISLLLNIIKNIIKHLFCHRILAYLLIVCLLMYILFTNLGPSIIRASIMAIIGIISKYIIHRQYHLLFALFLTAFIMFIFDQQIILSISFQLSMAATLGLIVIFPRITNERSIFSNSSFIDRLSKDYHLSNQEKKYQHCFCQSIIKYIDHTFYQPSFYQQHILIKKLQQIIKDSFFITLAAQSLTLPIIVFHFSELSLISLLANTFLLWLTPIITISGLLFLFLTLCLAFIPTTLNSLLLSLFATFINYPVSLFLIGIDFFARFDFLFFTIEDSKYLLIICYLILLIIWYFKRKS